MFSLCIGSDKMMYKKGQVVGSYPPSISLPLLYKSFNYICSLCISDRMMYKNKELLVQGYLSKG